MHGVNLAGTVSCNSSTLYHTVTSHLPVCRLLLHSLIQIAESYSWMIHQYLEELECSVLRSLVEIYNLIFNDGYSLVGECHFQT